MRTKQRCAALLLLLGLAAFTPRLSGAQSRPDRPGVHAPRLLISAFRTNDSLSRDIARRVGREARARVPISEVYVMIGPDLDINDANIPIRPLPWNELRKLARLVRASAIVDIAVHREQAAFVAQVERVVEPRGRPIVMLPTLRAQSGAELAAALAIRIVADTSLRQPSP